MAGSICSHWFAFPWFAVLLPAGTPEPIITRGNTELVAILGLPEVNVRASDCPSSAILDTTAVTRPQ